jgi:hypothetical protein
LFEPEPLFPAAAEPGPPWDCAGSEPPPQAAVTVATSSNAPMRMIIFIDWSFPLVEC